MKNLIKQQDEDNDELRKRLRETRKEVVDSQPSTLPWYVYVIVGAAGGVILTRGLR